MTLKFECPYCHSLRVYWDNEKKTMQCCKCKKIWHTLGKPAAIKNKKGGRN